MFHLCFLKYMIKLFFLSSLFIFVGILNHGKLYACSKHPDFFKRTPAFIVFSFDLQKFSFNTDRRNHFRHCVLESKFLLLLCLSQILHFKICISRKNTGTYFLLVSLKSQRMKTQHTFLSKIWQIMFLLVCCVFVYLEQPDRQLFIKSGFAQ